VLYAIIAKVGANTSFIGVSKIMERNEEKPMDANLASITRRKQKISKGRPTSANGYFTSKARLRLAESDEDLREIVRINLSLFPATSGLIGIDGVKLLRVWWERNREVFQVLEVNGKIVAYISLLPLPTAMTEAIFRDQIGVSKIGVDDIQTFEPGKPVDLYVWMFGMHPSIQGQAKRTFGRYLLAGLMNMFAAWGQRGIEIRSIYARSDTEDGISISQGLGFKEILPSPSKDQRAFILSVAESDQPLLINYMHALEDYQGKKIPNV
jgi:hypothetical protein